VEYNSATQRHSLVESQFCCHVNNSACCAVNNTFRNWLRDFLSELQNVSANSFSHSHL